MKLPLLILSMFACITGNGQLIYSVQSPGLYVVYGKSTDTKPTLPPINCYFIEINTGNTFISNGTSWVLQTRLQDSLTAVRSWAQSTYLPTATAQATYATTAQQSTAIALKSSIYVGIDAGANDSYVIVATPAPTSYTTGMVVIFKANTVNTGAASVNVNGLGVKTIVKRVNTVLANGDIPALSFKMLVYDGTNFTLLNPVVN